jgi:hypothetical protein
VRTYICLSLKVLDVASGYENETKRAEGCSLNIQHERSN